MNKLAMFEMSRKKFCGNCGSEDLNQFGFEKYYKKCGTVVDDYLPEFRTF